MVGVSDMFGFELLQRLYHNDIHKKEDVIILFIHWYLTKSGFRCIGIGDERVFDASEKGSELLPKEWSSRLNYTLRYLKDGKLYVLLGVRSDGDLLLNLLKHQNDSVSNIQFPIEETVPVLHGSLETVLPSYQVVLRSIEKNFMDSISSGNTKEAGIQTIPTSSFSATPRHIDPLREPNTREDVTHRPTMNFNPPSHDPMRVGVGDLNPFGQGGGMIFNPFQRNPGRLIVGTLGTLPIGAVPPNARFDPIRPLDPDPVRPHRPGRPDNDHLPPPGFDDMYY